LRIDHTSSIEKLNPNFSIIDFNDCAFSFEDMHALSSEIFADHYDFHPMEFDRWKEELTSGVHDTKLWRLAVVNGEVAGYCWGSHRFAEEKFGYISSIGVLRKFRGLGLAKALLNDAFQRDFAAGMNGSLLHCDAENPNGATALYEGAGMRIDRIYVAYRKLIDQIQAEIPS
jgi:ribosomal protein S18 acetylase RimI-like enzyme